MSRFLWFTVYTRLRGDSVIIGHTNRFGYLLTYLLTNLLKPTLSVTRLLCHLSVCDPLN